MSKKSPDRGGTDPSNTRVPDEGDQGSMARRNPPVPPTGPAVTSPSDPRVAGGNTIVGQGSAVGAGNRPPKAGK
jgi:hypothetical protein